MKPGGRGAGNLRAGARTQGLAAGICILFSLQLAPPASAQRAPVLQQVKVRHPYYSRELFVPQVTGGPESVAWPDGSELVGGVPARAAKAEFERREAPE